MFDRLRKKSKKLRRGASSPPPPPLLVRPRVKVLGSLVYLLQKKSFMGNLVKSEIHNFVTVTETT